MTNVDVLRSNEILRLPIRERDEYLTFFFCVYCMKNNIDQDSMNTMPMAYPVR